MSDVVPTPPLLSGSVGVRASGWWGVVFLVLSEASIFAYLFFAYFYYAVHFDYRPWPPYGAPSLRLPIAETVLIFFGAAGMWWADRRAALAVKLPALVGMAITIVLGIMFVLLGLLDWRDKPFALSSDAYSSIYFIMTGVHLAHAVVGVLMATAVLAWAGGGYFGPVRHVPVTVTAIYWYFLAATWAALFFTLYITPYLG